MRRKPAVALLGLAALVAQVMPVWATSNGARPDPVRPDLRLAQAAPEEGASSGTMPSAAGSGTPPGDGQPQPGGSAYPPPPATPPSSPTPRAAVTPALPVQPLQSGPLRNSVGVLPSMAQPEGGVTSPGSPVGTFGGPATTTGVPVYGSTTRDPSSTGLNTAPTGGAPATLGGTINGTAAAYGGTSTPAFSTNGSSFNASGVSGSGRATSATRDSRSDFNLRPLGAVPNTRDQPGTFVGRGGYNAQGVYTGTAPELNGNGYGYSSSYATTGRPVGGLLSTNVDATGPLRPYIPLNAGPIGRPNSGYGVPNGSRPSHMDGRGVQRVN